MDIEFARQRTDVRPKGDERRYDVRPTKFDRSGLNGTVRKRERERERESARANGMRNGSFGVEGADALAHGWHGILHGILLRF
jgi:hypothetical protein